MSPIRSKQHIIDENGIQIIESFFRNNGWIVRRQDKDYGIDLELEISSIGGAVTGKLAKIQVKSHENVRFKKFFTEYIPIELADYWGNIDLPVFLFVIDTHNQNIYWENVITGIRKNFKKGLKTIPFHVSKESELASKLSFEGFLYSIDHFQEIKNYRDASLFILKKFKSFLMLYERIHCSDSFLHIEEYADALKLHFEYVFAFPDYKLNKKYENVYNAFQQLSVSNNLAFIEFHQAIPICDTIFNYYYETITSIGLTILGLEHEYWKKIDEEFFDRIKNVKVPKTNREEDIFDFSNKYLKDDNIYQIFT